MMTAAELQALVADGLVNLGAHSRTHPSLPALPPAAQQAEIIESLRACAALTERVSRCFSYPFGDCSPATRALVAQAGCLGAVTTAMRAVAEQDDRFALPRLHVRDWDGTRFARAIGLARPRYFVTKAFSST